MEESATIMLLSGEGSDMTVGTTSIGALPSFLVKLDTSGGSALHILPKLLERVGLQALIPVVHYFVAVFLTFVPLVVFGEFGVTKMVAPSGSVKMPFFYDLTTLYLFLITLPCLLILTATDDQLLRRALSRVQADGIVEIAEVDGIALAKHWRVIFRRTNFAAEAIGLVAGAIVVYVQYRQATTTDLGSWVAPHRHVEPIGYVFFYCVMLFVVVATAYIFRGFMTGVLLWNIVSHAKLHILPLHPDKAGGLRPIGRLGLRNEYAIAVTGMNIAVAVFGAVLILKSWAFGGGIITATIAYLFLGPLVFIWPLLPFRDAMSKNKDQVMSGAALGMRAQVDTLRSRFEVGAATAEDVQLIDRLSKIGDLIDDLPVWPFDAITLRQFFTAYAIPAAFSGVGAAMKLLLESCCGLK
jgi:hypothetical protein